MSSFLVQTNHTNVIAVNFSLCPTSRKPTMNAPKKSQSTYSRVKRMNNKTKKNMLRNGRNVANMFNNDENVEVVNFEANYSPEMPKQLVQAGVVTPQRPTRSVFGAVGSLPSNAPGAPMKPRKLFRKKSRKNKTS